MRIRRHEFLMLVSTLAAGGCAQRETAPQVPPPTSTTTTTSLTTPETKAAAPALAPAPAPAPAPALAPAPRIVELLDPENDGLPGPTCEAALTLPMPGRTEEKPNVRIGALMVNGRHAPSAVRAALVSQGRAGITACFDKELTGLPEARRVAINVAIHADGKAGPSPRAAETPPDPLTTCLTAEVQKIAFATSSSESDVVVPLLFERKGFVPDQSRLAEWATKINAPCKGRPRR